MRGIYQVVEKPSYKFFLKELCIGRRKKEEKKGKGYPFWDFVVLGLAFFAPQRL